MRNTYIIAEAGVNHNGSLELALKLVDAAVQAGADAVKFQTFKAEKLVTSSTPKADYQIATTGGKESQLSMLKKLELNADAHLRIADYCQSHNIEFLSTPFDIESVDFLNNRLAVKRLKIPSGEITNAPLLLKASSTGLPVILSTGMSTMGEVEIALGILAFGYLKLPAKPGTVPFQEAYYSELGQLILSQKVILLHCTTAYPAPVEEANLRVLDTIHQTFGLPVGLSDHTPGITVAVAAVARGATVIEKHVTLDKGLPGPDHNASLEPDELTELVTAIRLVELALGSGRKVPTAAEIINKPLARQSLVAVNSIKKGELFSASNISTKRPGWGISPLYYWDWLGREADRDYMPDELIGS